MSSKKRLKKSKETFIFYLDLENEDKHILVSNFGIDLEKMMCGLLSVEGEMILKDSEFLSVAERNIYLCSDICENSIISGAIQLPILRKLKYSKEGKVDMDLNKVLWISTSHAVLRSIRLFLRNANGEAPSIESCNLNCTVLVFPKNLEA